MLSTSGHLILKRKRFDDMISAESKFGILTLRIDNIARRNSLTNEMIEQLVSELSNAQKDDDVRVVLLVGCSSVFCSGADLTEKDADKQTALLSSLFDLLAGFRKPIVAQVTGPAVAEGLCMLLYCDLIFANEHALFSMPSVALARTPRFGAAALMTNAAGFPKTAQKLLLSEPITANEAYDMHLVTEVVSDEHLENVVAAKVSRLACLPPQAVASTKELLIAARNDRIARTAALENELYKTQISTDEAREAMEAFLAGRPPVFRREDQ